MKKIIVLLCLCFFLQNVNFAQLKIITNGDALVYKQLTVGQDAGSSTARINVGKGRSGTGVAGIYFYHSDSNLATSTFTNSAAGSAIFVYNGTISSDFKTTTATPIRFFTNNQRNMQIRADGNVQMFNSATINGNIAVTSDKRLKKNTQPFTAGLAEVLKIKPIYYEYNGKASTPTGKKFIGVIAQELQAIAPYLVSEFEVDIIDKNTAEKNVIGKETYLKIHDSELKYLLINAIKEQQKQIEVLNKKIEILSKK